MSHGGRSRTPRRVQVFFFEKKTATRTLTLDDEPRTTVEPLKIIDPFEPFGPGEPAESAEPTVKTAALGFQRRPTPDAQPVTARELLRRAAVPQATSSAPRPTRETKASPPPPSRKATPAPQPKARVKDALAELAGLGDGSEAVLAYHQQKLEAHARQHGRSQIVQLATFAQDLFARGRVREAQVVFEGIVSREPDEAFPYTMLGAIYRAQQDDVRALALFEVALGIDPTDPAARVGRAEVRLKRGQTDLAKKDLEQVLAKDPSSADPFCERARRLSALGREPQRRR